MQRCFVGETIFLVEDKKGGLPDNRKLLQDFLNCRYMAFKILVAYINYMHKNVGFMEFIKGGPKSGEEVPGKVSYKAYRVGDDGLRIAWEIGASSFLDQGLQTGDPP